MIYTEAEIAAIQEKIKPILGKEMWLFQISPEGYLTLGSGMAVIPATGTPFAEYQLQIGYCVWRLETFDAVLTSSERDWEAIIAEIEQLKRHRLHKIEVFLPALETTITFDQDIRFKLFPIYSENEFVWRLYHRGEVILSVEPKPHE
jgi:hypothetical protein